MLAWMLMLLVWMQRVPAAPPGAEPPVAFVGATVIDGTGRPPIRNGVVVMQNGKFVAVGKRGQARVPAVARKIDVTGKWLIPGLIDMHVHLDEVLTPGAFPLYGVTTVRDVGSNGKVIHILRVRGKTETLPRIYWMGQNIDQGKPSWWGAVAVKNVQDVPRLLDGMQAQGVDGVKLYVLAKPDVTRAVIADAHRRVWPVTAHLGSTLPSQAADAGIDNLEHVTTLFQELRVLPPRTKEGYGKTFAGVPAVNLRGRKTRRLLNVLAHHHVAITPTLAVALLPWKGGAGTHDVYAGWSDVPDGWQRFWHDPYWEFIGTKGWTESDFDRARRSETQFLRLVGLLHQRGIGIVAGTDTPAPWTLPGASLLVELELLTKAGLSPGEAIEAATGRAAHVLHKADKVGTIQAGRYADCILLDADPLADIRNARHIRAVYMDGKLVNRAVLKRDFQNADSKAVKLGP